MEILEQYSILQNVKIEYKICKQEFNTLYDEISTGIKIRSRSEWYEFGKKKKIFFNLEKYHASQYTVNTITSEKQEITDIHEINCHMLNLYKNLFVGKS